MTTETTGSFELDLAATLERTPDGLLPKHLRQILDAALTARTTGCRSVTSTFTGFDGSELTFTATLREDLDRQPSFSRFPTAAVTWRLSRTAVASI